MSVLSFGPIFWIMAACLLLAAYWLVRPTRIRKPLLLLGSGVFYFSVSWRLGLMLVAMTAIVFILGRYLEGNREKPGGLRLTASVLITFLPLIYFKYSGLLIETWTRRGAGLDSGPLTVPQMLLPLGISYFTFQFVHYLVEINRGNIRNPGILDFFTFTFFFPSITAGPIKRFTLYSSHNPAKMKFDADRFIGGLVRVLVGLGKKLIVAGTIYPLTPALSQPQEATANGLVIAVFWYAIYIYVDFSGYTDMAVGAAKLFGYRIEENFSWPYLKSNPGAFWKAWHMSLTGWLRDYVFIPLGGSRGGFLLTARNTVIVMGLIGLWHGPAGRFLAWGLYHAALLIGYRIYKLTLGDRLEAFAFLDVPRKILGALTTFGLVAIGWIFFACDFQTAWQVLAKIAGLN